MSNEQQQQDNHAAPSDAAPIPAGVQAIESVPIQEQVQFANPEPAQPELAEGTAESATTKPQIEQQGTPRKPGALPAGATLADRIAALQKSSSIRGGKGGRTDRSASSHVGGASTPGGQESVVQNDATARRSVSSGPRVSGGSNGGGGVRDRIAKFQADDEPLIPKSSFGSPAPMHADRNQNALRPYPGALAAGGGSGQWGEGVLRPQMTGGTWVGAGEGRGWQTGEVSAANVRPQLTGGAWLGVGGSDHSSLGRKGGYPSSGFIVPRSPMKQRDAFLDLDEEASSTSSSTSPQKARVPLRRDSSFSEAQLSAASMGLQRQSSRANSTDGRSESGDGQSTTDFRKEGLSSTQANASSLLTLPNVPRQDVVAKGSRVFSLPSAPSDAPGARVPSTLLSGPTSTNDVEISVANVTPAKLEKLRRTASGSYADSFLSSPISDDSADQARDSQTRSALLSELHARRGMGGPIPRRSSSIASADDATTDIGRLIISSNDTDDDRSSVASQRSGAPGLPTQTPETTVSQEEVIAPQAESAFAPVTSLNTTTQLNARRHGRIESNESGILDPMSASTSVDTIKRGDDAVPSANGASNASAPVRAPTTPTSTPGGGITKSQSEGLNDLQSASAAAATKAKEAIAAARSKSQRLKRPPPGRMMTAAEMDASDDEYEPGWASVTTVLSSSRQT